MANLRDCIDKAGKAILRTDAEALFDIWTELETDASVPVEAAEDAIDQVQRMLDEDRNALIEEARNSGANVSEVTGSNVTFTRFNDPGNLSASTIRATEYLSSEARREVRAVERTMKAERLERERKAAPRTRFGLRQLQVDEIDEDPTSETVRQIKLGAFFHDAGKNEEGVDKTGKRTGLAYVAAIMKKAGETASKGIRAAALAGAPLRNLGEFIRTTADGKASDMEKAFDDLLLESDRMGATQSGFVNQFMVAIDDWKKYVRKDFDGAGAMHGVMHRATLARTDPAEEYVPEFNVEELQTRADRTQARIDRMDPESQGYLRAANALKATLSMIEGEQKRKSEHASLEKQFNSMPKEAQKIYRDVRDQYAEIHDLNYQALLKKIQDISEKSDTPVSPKTLDEIKKNFEHNTIRAPYFPLSRFGDYFAVAKNEDGEVMAFSKFEYAQDGQRDAWVKSMEARGFKTAVGTESKSDTSAMAGTVDVNFAKNVVAKLMKLPGGNRIADEIWQMYLMRLPEMSARKSAIHRKGVEGYNSDALRAYAHHAFKTARSLSRTLHGHKIDDALLAVRNGATKLTADTGGAATWAMPVYDELYKRHEWQMNPTSQPIASMLVKMGFHAFLGFNLSSAAVNWTQSWIVGVPVLGARYGVLNAGREIAKASNDMRHLEVNWKDYLTPVELRAMTEAERLGIFEKTRTYELQSMGDSGEAYVANWQQAEYLSAFAFSKVEAFNRKLTYLAAFRLAHKDGQGENFEDATRAAWKLTWDTHFDYSNANRPRVMQGSAGRVALLFRNYGFNMAYRLGKDFIDTINRQEMNPQQKRAARVRFSGMIGATMLVAGMRGLPMVGVVGAALTLAFGDDDDPIDMWDSTRRHLSEMLGDDVADAMMDGPVSSMTNVDVSKRLSLSNLFFRDAPPEMEMFSGEWFSNYAFQATGPLGSWFNDIRRGAGTVLENESDEKVWRGAELMLPTQMRNAAKSLRYFLEDGVKSWSGQDVLEEGAEVAAWSKAMQAAGFSPYDLNLRYQEVGDIYGIQRRLIDRRTELLGRMSAARINQDQDRIEAVTAEIREWNKTQFREGRPRIRISGKDIFRSFRSKQRATKEYLGGRRFSVFGRELARQRGLKR